MYSSVYCVKTWGIPPTPLLYVCRSFLSKHRFYNRSLLTCTWMTKNGTTNQVTCDISSERKGNSVPPILENWRKSGDPEDVNIRTVRMWRSFVCWLFTETLSKEYTDFTLLVASKFKVCGFIKKMGFSR